MKTLKLLSILVFAVFLVSTVSAIGVYGSWEDSSQSICTLRDEYGNCQSVTITEGGSIDFNGDFISISPPMTLNIVLYDAQDNVIETFESGLIVSDTSYFPTYTIDSSIYSTPGNYELVLRGSDKSSVPAQAYDDWSLSLTVKAIPQNNAPQITSNPLTQVNEGEQYSYDVDATDADSDTLTYSLTQGPSWLSIDSVTGLVTGTSPAVSSNTTYDIEVEVSDGEDSDSQAYTLTVVDTSVADKTPPVINVITPQPAVYSISDLIFEISTNEPLSVAEYSLDSAANIPMTETTTNTFESVLLTLSQGAHSVTFTATDVAGNPATETVDFSVDLSGKAPTITVITPEEDEEYDDSELTFEVEVDEVAEVTFSLDNDPQVTMDYQGMSNGVLTFTYDVDLDDGDYEVVFYATDVAGNTASVTVEFSIDTSTSNRDNDNTITNNQDNYEEELYLDQFKPKNIIYLEDDEPEKKELNWWQRFVEWLKRIFGFN